LDPRGVPIPELIKTDSSSTDNIKINKPPASKLTKDLEIKSSTSNMDNIKPYKPPVSKLAKASAVDPSTPAKWTKETEKKLKDVICFIICFIITNCFNSFYMEISAD
jgi:hypothetical protein